MRRLMGLQRASGRGVADRWRSQYYDPQRGWSTTYSGDSETVYNKLCALGVNPPIDRVAEIIGNKGWSYLTCDCCSEEVDRAILFSRSGEDDYRLCLECVKDANKLASP